MNEYSVLNLNRKFMRKKHHSTGHCVILSLSRSRCSARTKHKKNRIPLWDHMDCLFDQTVSLQISLYWLLVFVEKMSKRFDADQSRGQTSSGRCRSSLALCSVQYVNCACLRPSNVSAVWALAVGSACRLLAAEQLRRQMDCWIRNLFPWFNACKSKRQQVYRG